MGHGYLESLRHTGFAFMKVSKASSRPRVPTERSAPGVGTQDEPKVGRRLVEDSCRTKASMNGEDAGDGSARRTA